MKNNLTTVILFFIMLILIIGIVIFGKAIYNDLLDSNSNQITYKLDSIATEEPEETKEQTNKTQSNLAHNISDSIQSTFSNNLEETTDFNTYNENEIVIW